MSQRLSSSATFQSLSDRVLTLEINYATILTPSGITGALGYVPANKAGETFTGPVFSDVFNCSPSGSAGGLQISRAFSSGFTGIVEFLKSNGTRNGFVGFNAESGPMHYGSDTGAGHFFEGGSISPDPNMRFGMRFNSVDGVIDFDTNDTFYYSRSSDTFIFTIASSAQMTLSGQGLFVANLLQVGDGNFGLSLNGGTDPIHTFDANDYLGFNRSTNTYHFNIANAPVLSLAAANAVFAGSINVANDSNFSAAIVSGNPIITVDATDFIKFDRVAKIYGLHIGGTPYLTVNAATTAVTALQVYDVNFTVGVVSSQPRITFDNGDYISYDRTANKFFFAVGGTAVASIDGSGNMRIKGALTQGVTP